MKVAARTRPNLLYALLAAIVAVCAPLLSGAMGNADLLALRAVFAAGLVLYSADVVDAARVLSIQRGARPWDRLTAALLAGWQLAGFAALLLWSGPDAQARLALTLLVMIAVYSGLTLLLLSRPPVVPGGAERFDLSRPVTDRPGARAIYHLWPFAVAALMAGLAVYPPESGWSARYFLSQVIILPFLISAYPGRPGSGFWRNPLWTRLAGMALILIGLFAA